MLDDKSRVILFWFTIGMIVLVVIVALTTLLRACGGPLQGESPLAINPVEISLCLGEQRQFTVEGIEEEDAELSWRTNGGTISESGPFSAIFVADGEPGDYIITVIRRSPRQVTDATVHVTACTPTPTSTPTPIPTPTPLPSPTPTSTPVPTPSFDDPRGDVGTYDAGLPVDGVPIGADIRIASVGTDLRLDLQPAAGVPTDLAGWAAEGDALLWITLYDPIPNPPAYTDWLFALDLDGNVSTGRPVGSARINPDLGDEAVVGVLYDPASGEYAPYFLVWDPAQGGWTDGPEGIRFTLGQSRTVIGLALPMETITNTVAQTTDVTFVPGAVKGRAAVLSVAGEQTVVDFYPDRP